MEGVRARPLPSSGWTEWLTRVAGPPAATTNYYRSIWISDLHLGTPRCKAEALYDFLRHHEAENLYLVGDIVDGWVLGPSWYWSPAQTAVVEEVAAWHRRGTRVVFLPGNHDELSAELVQAFFGPIPILSELIHQTAEGRRMLGDRRSSVRRVAQPQPLVLADGPLGLSDCDACRPLVQRGRRRTARAQRPDFLLSQGWSQKRRSST